MDRRSHTSSLADNDYYPTAAYYTTTDAHSPASSSLYEDDDHYDHDHAVRPLNHDLSRQSSQRFSSHSRTYPAPLLQHQHPSAVEHHRYSVASSTYSSDDRASQARSSVPSFSAFRSQAPSVPLISPIALRQRPSPSSPARHTSTASLSSVTRGSPRIVPPSPRPFSVDSRIPPPHSSSSGAVNSALPTVAEIPSPRREVRASYAFPLPGSTAHQRTVSIDSRLTSSDAGSSQLSPKRTSSIPIHTRYASEASVSRAPQSSSNIIISPSSRRASQATPTGPGAEASGMALQFEGVQRTLSNESLGVDDALEASRPKSPGGRLGNLFGWKASPSLPPSRKSSEDSPSTASSDRSMSPLPSPHVDKPLPPVEPPSPHPVALEALDIPKSKTPPSYFDYASAPVLAGSPENLTHVKELERELAQVSAELAASIRREMDLEDDLDRMRIEMPSMAPSDSGRRGSDYFSDSGASSVRFPITDYDSKLEQLERSLRKVEQEKANIKLDMASRLQSELSRRRDLEQMVQTYEVQLKKSIDDHGERSDMEDRVDVLEGTLEDTRRLLSQERQAKDSFEDLYSATRGELEQHRNELDNLRDEVVPQLRARVEGLESEVATKEALTYENARMQQELNSLRERLGGPYSMIAEENDDNGVSRGGQSRSASTARGHGKRGGSLTRTGSTREGGRQRSGSLNGPVTAEGMKEIEDQRDALHKALKLLITRHDKQQKEHERAIKKITRTQTREASRSPYHQEVAFLKEEVTTLRKRTEDALEQKYQYEKGLSGIKMDLDRAEQETRGLRTLLRQHDIAAPSPLGRRPSDSTVDGGHGDELTLIISSAEDERDQARQSANEYRQRAASAQPQSATQLLDSAKRMEDLASQLEGQVQSNVQLRERLSKAVNKGESEQRESNAKIEEMQKRLAGLEDSVIAAQQHSETSLGAHEADMRKIEEASSPALRRLSIEIPEHGRLVARSPSLLRSSSGSFKKLSDTSLLESSRTHMLERKVRELESLLREAEQDMQDVVQRVNKSQIEVNELQTERDAAMTQMHKLQTLIVQERERAEQLR